MRTVLKKFLSCIGALALAFVLVPSASAKCGLPSKPIKPMSWHPQYGEGNPKLLRAGLEDHEPSIVGMWHVILTAQTSNGEPITDQNGKPTTQGIDNAVVVWHSDGTEIMNSDRPAQDGNFCLGVWERTGERSYYLNHIPWQGNADPPPPTPQNIIGPQQGGVQILEKVTLSPDGNSYSGTFTLTAYDTSGNVVQTFTGVLLAKRITPETPFSDLL
jgi:hypothetical protein